MTLMARAYPLTDQMYVRIDGEYVKRDVDYFDAAKRCPVPVKLEDEEIVWHIGSLVPEIVRIK